jgi:hypothetical protein
MVSFLCSNQNVTDGPIGRRTEGFTDELTTPNLYPTVLKPFGIIVKAVVTVYNITHHFNKSLIF